MHGSGSVEERTPEARTFVEVLEHASKERIGAESVDVPYEEESFAGASECNIQAPAISDEPSGSSIVAADEGKDAIVGLTPLESIDGVDLDCSEIFSEERANGASLACIRSDNGYRGRRNASCSEASDNSNDDLSLSKGRDGNRLEIPNGTTNPEHTPRMSPLEIAEDIKIFGPSPVS
ncbi:hypothetical protein AB1Y20_004174 [Prymnesium parvum]|uniref:Uncharacterized protein n=1 Tax=Prymnesium parvum TaxID=97485 RepID=A0AB34J7D6_PRYPA